MLCAFFPPVGCLLWNDDIDELCYKFIWFVCAHNEHTQYKIKIQIENSNRLIYSPMVANALSMHNGPMVLFFFIGFFFSFICFCELCANINGKNKVKCQQIQEIKREITKKIVIEKWKKDKNNNNNTWMPNLSGLRFWLIQIVVCVCNTRERNGHELFFVELERWMTNQSVHLESRILLFEFELTVGLFVD